MVEIKLYFTKLDPNTSEGFRIPLISGNIYPDFHRENGSTAKVVDNRLIITTPYVTEEYAVSFELNGINPLEALRRNNEQDTRFWRVVEGVVMARLSNLVRYINRHSWQTTGRAQALPTIQRKEHKPMDKNNIQVPTFEGYDKTPRWEQDGLSQFVAFEDGATFGYVTFIVGEGWVSRCLGMADDGTDLIDSGFFTATQAMEYANKVYAEWQEHLASLELDLDIDEELLKAMEGMEADEVLKFLELLDEDDEI